MQFCRVKHINSRINPSFRLFSCSRYVNILPQGVSDSASVLLPRSLIAVHGYDSAKFLNGLITIRPPEYTNSINDSGKYACMLNAKGRVIADLFVYPAHEVKSVQASIGSKKSCYLIEVETSQVEKILDVLDFHVLLSDVEIKVLKNHNVHALWNDAFDVDINNLSSSTLWTSDKRAPGLGFRVITDEATQNMSELPAFSNYKSASFDEYRVRRYLFGIPEGTKEITPDKALPLDSCIDFMGGIDFNKGCYMGQELTIRTYHHGNVRKRVMPVVFAESAEASLSDDLYEPKELGVEPGMSIQDVKPIPNEDTLTPIFGSSPFGNSSSKRSPSRPRPAGEVISALGNVGLVKMRVDTLGHDFRLGDLFVKPMTPFWWPTSEIVHEK